MTGHQGQGPPPGCEDPAPAPKGSGPFYGWYIVGVAFMANFVSVGTGFYLFNIFMVPLCDAYGWTRTEANLALTLGTLFGFAGQFVYGSIVDRVGPRALMAAGSVMAGGAFALLSQARELWLFYLLYVALFLGNGAYGGIVANSAVNNWFVEKRGKALGLATSGVSASGAVAPYLALMVLGSAGLEWSFVIIGATILFVGPLAFLIVRNRPEDQGLLPDGASLDEEICSLGEDQLHKPVRGGIDESGNVLVGAERAGTWTPGMLVRTAAFWRVGLAYGLVMIGVVGVMSQLKAHFTDTGFDDRTATLLMSGTALLGAFGKYFWGALCDRYDSSKVAATLMTLGGVGLSMIFLKDSLPFLILFILIFGLAMGGVMSTFPVIIAELYGRYSFASVARFVAIFLVLEVLGYVIAGQSFDRTGSYNTAYAVFLVLDLVAVVLVIGAKKPGRPLDPDKAF